ncbi:MAG TPA: cupredoxin domain-containing protein [Pararhizobium sp.]|nr:cupredoxin domain-containing protein [Pararhizobium sp.]
MRMLFIVACVLLAAPISGTAFAAEHTITIKNMKFGPVPSGLHVGDVIVWKNDDILRHTATARDKSFDVDLPPHSTKELTLKKAGTLAFYCRFHPGMTGTLVVAP